MARRLRALRRYARGRGLRRRALARVARAADGRALARHPVLVRVRLRVRTRPARARLPCGEARRRPGGDPAGPARPSRRARRKVRRYPGLKEEYSLHGFVPAPTVLDELGLDRGRVLVVVRTPPDVSLYHRHGNPLFARGARASRARPDGAGSRPARTAEQRDGDRAPGSPSLVVPGAGDRRAEPRRARRPRRLGRRHDEPRGRRARRARLHDVCRQARRGRHGSRERRKTSRPDLGGRAHAREARPARTRRSGIRRCSSTSCSRRSSASATVSIWLGSLRQSREGRRDEQTAVARPAVRLAAVSALRRRRSVSRRRQPQRLQDSAGRRCSIAVMAGVTVTPLLTVGDLLPSGYRFEAIPDGISVRTRGQGRVDLFVNHETSKVPFPFVIAAPDRGERGERLRQRAGEPADPQSALGRGAQRLVRRSRAAAATSGSARTTSRRRRKGSTAKSSSRTRSRPTTCCGRRPRGRPPSGNAGEREAGLVVALDVQTGKHTPITGMGRHNHENNVPIPGFDDLGRPLGRRHVYERPPDRCPVPAWNAAVDSPVAALLVHRSDTDALLADEGELWAFVSDTPGIHNYYDVPPGSGTDRHGQFIKVPKMIASGLQARRHRGESRRLGISRAADEWQLAGRPTARDDSATGRHRRTSVGARVLEPHQQRVRVRARRGHRVRQAAQHGQRRIHRRLGAWTHGRSESRHAFQVDERPRLEDGARPRRPEDRDVTLDSRRGRRQPGEDAQRDPPAGQRRVDTQWSSRDGGSRIEPAVHGRTAGVGSHQRNDGTALVRPVRGHCLRSS